MSMIGCFAKITPSQLQGVIQDPDSVAALVFSADESSSESIEELDLDKAWNLIHFLLTGDTWGGEGPLAKAIMGGEVLEDTDTGYGPFRYHEPGQVRLISEALGKIDSEALWQNFDAQKVKEAEVYPIGAWEGSDEDKQYTCQNFDELKRFYSEAARDSSALLLYIA